MKVAGSSWGGGLLPPLFIYLFISIVTSINPQCMPPDRVEEYSSSNNLIDELVQVSDKKTEVSKPVDELLEPYDATPFWYNLIQAISLASGITPTTEVVMHQLVTSSFYSSELSGAIRKVLSVIKCGQNMTELQQVFDENVKMQLQEQQYQLRDKKSELNEDRMSGSDNLQDSGDDPDFKSWTPWDEFMLSMFNMEEEQDLNSLLGKY